MKRHFTIILLFFLVSNANGQVGQKGLQLVKLRLQSADSVLIVSHEATAGIALIDSVTRKILPLPQLFIRGKLNNSIVQEKKKLDSTAVEQLNTILTRPFAEAFVSQATCFVPYHSILIFKRKKVSCISLCFGCNKFTTENLQDIDQFDRKKWNDLLVFFMQNNMRYKLHFEASQETDY